MTYVHIDSKGYGKIYQAVMRNPEIPLTAKGIYSYFCAYAGNDIIAFPRRDKIVRDLKLNKDTYTKYLNMLVLQGYINTERTTTGNLYTVIQTIPAYKSQENPEAKIRDNEKTDILVMENVKARGFGTIPKLAMLDQRLTAQSKAIYAYFCSFAGAGSTAFPRRNTITRELGITLNTYYSHFNLLLDWGYVSVEKRRGSGRYMVNVYHLTDSIETSKAVQQAMSKKNSHGENGAIMSCSEVGDVLSPKSRHGCEMQIHSDICEVVSEELRPGKLSPDKSILGDFGHGNININNKTNTSFEKEQGYNHQGTQDDGTVSLPILSLQEVKEQIRYPFLLKEMEALSKLKQMLEHFPDLESQRLFEKKTREIVEELPQALLRQIRSAKDNGRTFMAMEDGVILRLLDDLSDHWEGIKNVKRYVEASVSNMFHR